MSIDDDIARVHAFVTNATNPEWQNLCATAATLLEIVENRAATLRLVAELQRLRAVNAAALSTLDLIANGACRHEKASQTECEDLARATLERVSQ